MVAVSYQSALGGTTCVQVAVWKSPEKLWCSECAMVAKRVQVLRLPIARSPSGGISAGANRAGGLSLIRRGDAAFSLDRNQSALLKVMSPGTQWPGKEAAHGYWRIRRIIPWFARTSSVVLIFTSEVSLPPPMKTSSRSITFGSIKNIA